MKRQIGCAEAEIAGKKRVTGRQRFLAEIVRVVPWQPLLLAIEPHCLKGTARPLADWLGANAANLLLAIVVRAVGRRTGRCLDSIALRAFAGIYLAVEDVPDATTLLKFPRLLTEHEPTRKFAHTAHKRSKRLRWSFGPIAQTSVLARSQKLVPLVID